MSDSARTSPKKRCRICRREFEPRLSTQVCCSPNCAIAYARSQPKAVAKTAAKLVRQETREKKQELKSVRDLLKEAQRHFNKFIRLRDYGRSCICCGRVAKASHLTGGEYDAGHYRSIGAAAHLRFNEDNCHRQLKQCNRDKSGNVVEYRKRLIERIGLERVEALENDNRTHKWTRDEVLSITRIYRAKCREFTERG